MLTLPFVLLFAAFTAAWYATLGSAALSDEIAPTLTQISRALLSSANAPLAIGIGAAVYACVLVLIYVLARRAQWKASKLPRLFGAPVVVLSVSLMLARYCGISVNELLQLGRLSPLHEVAEFLYLLGLLLIIVGLAALALRRCRFTFDQEFAALALASLAILMTAAAIPFLAAVINTTRLYHISTLLLAPFCVTGALLVAGVPGRLRAKRRETTGVSLAYKLVAALFVVMLLFSTGLVYEVTRQDPTSFFLNDAIDAPRFNAREVAGAQWLYAVKGSDTSTAGRPVYADVYRGLLWTSLDFNHSLEGLSSPAAKTPLAGTSFWGLLTCSRGRARSCITHDRSSTARWYTTRVWPVSRTRVIVCLMTEAPSSITASEAARARTRRPSSAVLLRHSAGFGRTRSEERGFCPFSGHVEASVRAVSEQLVHPG